MKRHYEIRFNTISLEYELKRREGKQYQPLNENSLFVELQKAFINVSVAVLVSIIRSGTVCAEYDPIRDYFSKLGRWTNREPDYIEALASYLKMNDQTSFIYHFKKHLVRTVKCALDTSYVNKQCLVLVGTRQNTGKTTFIRYLTPPELNRYRAENISVDKDSRISICKNFMINLDELDHLDRKDLNSLKSLFSKDWVNDRLPYDRTASQIPRRCSFLASTNLTEFLSDETGSSRWVCFTLLEAEKPIDFQYTKINISNVWRQAYSLYQQGFQADLTPDEVRDNELRNKAFRLSSTEFESIYKIFEPDLQQLHENFKTPTEILKILLDEMGGTRLNLHRVGVGKALVALGYRRFKQGGIYGYYIKPRNLLTQVTQTSETLAESCPY
ncbi:virulence-associated E family protein [candidate division KSB1 bacterium]|nr:virulence-associated E family protein [candidate division KSB1 bacterium]